MEKVFLGLGSNEGDSIRILGMAVQALAEGLTSLRVSSVWKSEPRYLVDQPPFYNIVVEGQTSLEPEELLSFTSSVEARFGRDRSKEVPKGPRSLDIDLLLIGARSLRTENLTIPHPGMRERKFVLLPLLELDRGLCDPIDGLPFLSALSELAPQGIYLIPRQSYDRLHI